MSVRKCFVPKCKNNAINAPNKHLLPLPVHYEQRNLWFQAVGRRYSKSANLRCCEDHFNLEEDAENFLRYKCTGCRLILKSTVVPHKFIERPNADVDHCQIPPELKERIIKATLNYEKEKQRKIDEFLKSMPDEMGKRKATYYHKKRNKQSKAAQLRFSKTKIPLIIAAREQTSHTLNEYVKDPSEHLLESSEIKIEEPDIKQELLQEDLLDIDPSLNTNVNIERMTINSINGECAVFNTASNETSSLNTEWNGDGPKSEFIKCESDYDGTIYLYSETLEEGPVDNNFKQINDVDIATENFNVSNEDGRTVGTASSGPSSQVRTCPRCKYVF